MTPILHHYPPSLFSEKIRALFGYLGVDWQSVIIPPIMPRPHLMPLSGGYRKTPIMQIGANVYCDTAVISRKLAELAGDETLYAHGFAADRAARWADTELFRITVALNFREEALAAQMSQMSAEAVEAFQKDRAELSGGAPIVGSDPATAEAQFASLLAELDETVGEGFLFGAAPCIADFSLYHCLWFVDGNAANKPLLAPWPNVQAYLERMRAFGHATVTELGSEAALQLGTEATPVDPDIGVDARFAGDLSTGDAVTVAADDYGRHAIAGTLLGWSAHEIVIHRVDAQAGDIHLHVPALGFEVKRAAS